MERQIKELLAQRVKHDVMCNAGSKGNKPTPSTSGMQETELPSDVTAVGRTSVQSSLSHGIENTSPTKRGLQDETNTALTADSSVPTAKRSKPTAQNFLLVGAKRAKELKSARNAARVGFARSEGEKLSHTGSGVPLARVLRLKYVKGFTEAVRKPCTLQDLN
jgi:chromosome transmission fidelity protein 18